MVMNMFGQRRRAAKARADANKSTTTAAPLAGLLFPELDGERSTTVAGKNIFAASVAAASPDDATAIKTEKNWRFGYAKHVVRNVELSLASPAAAIDIATRGLDAAMSSFDFIRDGKSMKLKDAMSTSTGTFHTGFVKGTAPKPKPVLQVPYNGKILQQEELLTQLNKYVLFTGSLGTVARNADVGCIFNVMNIRTPLL